jgi:hypothetical protein
MGDTIITDLKTISQLLAAIDSPKAVTASSHHP